MKPGIPSSMGKKMTLEEAQELARRDKRRLLLMGGGAIALAAFYVFARMNEEGQGTGGSLPGSQNAEVPLEPAVETIPFDQARRYVMRVSSMTQVYHRLYRVPGPIPPIPSQLPTTLGSFDGPEVEGPSNGQTPAKATP